MRPVFPNIIEKKSKTIGRLVKKVDGLKRGVKQVQSYRFIKKITFKLNSRRKN